MITLPAAHSFRNATTHPVPQRFRCVPYPVEAASGHWTDTQAAAHTGIGEGARPTPPRVQPPPRL